MSNNFKFSKRSWEKLHDVHPKLVAVASRALLYSVVDFAVWRGIRDIETQRRYVRAGWSQTMNSKHLPQEDGYAHAVDLRPYHDGSYSWDHGKLALIAPAMQKAADELGVKITWGGSWTSFVDMPHFQLENP